MSHSGPPERPERDGEPTREMPTTIGAHVPGSEPVGSLRYAGPVEEHAGPADDHAGPADKPGEAETKRFWSPRRVPSAITAACVFGLSGLFLYDVSSVRAGRKAMSWRKTLAEQLATRHLDNVWIILGAIVCGLLGLWLLVLAFTPGERGVLPMARGGAAGLRAGLDRHAAALVLRDRAMEVAGIRSARVAVGRSRVRVRAASHFRELADVRRDLDQALDQAVRQLGLAKPPNLRVHVERADKKA